MLKKDIELILKSQSDYFEEDQNIIQRDILKRLKPTKGFVTIITGIRRAGKSTLLKSLISKNKKKCQYLHFDDPRLLSFDIEDFYAIEEICGQSTIYYYDELHQVKTWERYIRHACERKIELTITGSNASMLSTELTTLLTGRHLSYELFPYNYKEYLSSNSVKNNIEQLKNYMIEGGFPEFQRSKNREIHRQLLKDIIDRDIIARYSIRDAYAFMQVTMHLINNIARPMTYRKLARSYGIKSVNTVITYMQYLENAYLFFIIHKYDHRYKKQQSNEKKIYAIDNGLVVSNTIKIQDDHGRLFENMIFLHLRQQYDQVHYYKNKGECDFIVSQNGKPVCCYQVCYDLNRHNQEGEVNGCIEAMTDLKLKKGYIVTLDQNDKMKQDKVTINIISADKLFNIRTK